MRESSELLPTGARDPDGVATVTVRGGDWLFERAVRRVDVIDELVADYAVSICGRPMRRRVSRSPHGGGALGTVTWSIDDDVVVELSVVARGRHEVAVYDVGLLRTLRQALRRRHVRVTHRSREAERPANAAEVGSARKIASSRDLVTADERGEG